MYKDKKIGVVVPAFNEERLIQSVIIEMPDFIDKVYIVDDASTDNTHETALNTNRTQGDKVVIKHEKNSGVGRSIITGYKACLSEDIDIAVVMAGDHQMDPAQLPNLLAPIIEKGAGYTKGDRMSYPSHRRSMPKWRRFGNWLLRWLTRIASGNYKLMDPQNGYTAITRETLKQINLDNIHPAYGYCNDILVKLSAHGTRIIEVPMPARYGHEKSKIRYRSYIPKLSWLLLKRFMWRLKVKYARGT